MLVESSVWLLVLCDCTLLQTAAADCANWMKPGARTWNSWFRLSSHEKGFKQFQCKQWSGWQENPQFGDGNLEMMAIRLRSCHSCPGMEHLNAFHSSWGCIKRGQKSKEFKFHTRIQTCLLETSSGTCFVGFFRLLKILKRFLHPWNSSDSLLVKPPSATRDAEQKVRSAWSIPSAKNDWRRIS